MLEVRETVPAHIERLQLRAVAHSDGQRARFGVAEAVMADGEEAEMDHVHERERLGQVEAIILEYHGVQV